MLRCDHTAEQAQQRRFTAAAGPFYEYPLFWKDSKIAYVHDVVLIPGPTKLQVLQLDDRMISSGHRALPAGPPSKRYSRRIGRQLPGHLSVWADHLSFQLLGAWEALKQEHVDKLELSRFGALKFVGDVEL